MSDNLKYYVIKKFNKHYLVEKNFIKTFIIDNKVKWNKITISNFCVELTEKDKNNSYLFKKQNHYYYYIKKLDYYLASKKKHKQKTK